MLIAVAALAVGDGDLWYFELIYIGRLMYLPLKLHKQKKTDRVKESLVLIPMYVGSQCGNYFKEGMVSLVVPKTLTDDVYRIIGPRND